MNTRNHLNDNGKIDETSLQYLTYPQAAALLQMSERKLATMKKNGDIPYIQLGKSVRFGRADLEQWLQQQTRGGNSNGNNNGEGRE